MRASDWWAHRHHDDPAYHRVILHVAMWPDVKVGTGGPQAMLLALNKYLGGTASLSQGRQSTMACRGMARAKTDIVEFLDTAGDKRLLAKSARFEADLAETEAGQCLYQGIMAALGYSKNRAPFLDLARRLPLRTLEFIAQANADDEEYLAQTQGLMLGTAGLLPSQRRITPSNDRWVEKLEAYWTSFTPSRTMSFRDWHLFRVRPVNFPARRVAAMSYLCLRYREEGLLDWVLKTVRESAADWLERGLMVVAADGYWASHFDFTLDSVLRSPTLLGRDRAADIVVNVILPLAMALGKLAGQSQLQSKATELYRGHPRLMENTLERHMSRQIGVDRSLINSARRQQGLIYIYEALCTQGRCCYCPLSA